MRKSEKSKRQEANKHIVGQLHLKDRIENVERTMMGILNYFNSAISMLQGAPYDKENMAAAAKIMAAGVRLMMACHGSEAMRKCSTCSGSGKSILGSGLPCTQCNGEGFQRIEPIPGTAN